MNWYINGILWTGAIRTVGVGRDFATLDASVLDAISNSEDSLHVVYDDHTMTARIYNGFDTIYNQYIVGYGTRKVIQGNASKGAFSYGIGKVYLENIHLTNHPDYHSRWLYLFDDPAELHTNRSIISTYREHCVHTNTGEKPTVKLHSTKLFSTLTPTLAFVDFDLTNVYLDKVSYEGAYTESSCTGLKALDDKAITGTSGLS